MTWEISYTIKREISFSLLRFHTPQYHTNFFSLTHCVGIKSHAMIILSDNANLRYNDFWKVKFCAATEIIYDPRSVKTFAKSVDASYRFNNSSLVEFIVIYAQYILCQNVQGNRGELWWNDFARDFRQIILMTINHQSTMRSMCSRMNVQWSILHIYISIK